MRYVAAVCAVLAVLAAAVTAAGLGLALIPEEGDATAGGDWGFVLISAVAAVVLGALAVALGRQSD